MPGISISKDDIAALRASKLFDAQWYLETYPDVGALDMDPAEHYLFIGARLNRDPSPDFNTGDYVRRHPELARNGLNPLLHCLANNETPQEARSMLAAPDYTPRTDVPTQDVEVIRASQFFNPEWYLRTYPDVGALGMDPAEHYLWIGARLNRDPSPDFSTSEYQKCNPELLRSGPNPLLHFLAPRFMSETPSTSPADSATQATCVPVHSNPHADAQGPGSTSAGSREKAAIIQPPQSKQDQTSQVADLRVSLAPYVDAAFYLRKNPDVRASGLDPLTHFMKNGFSEGRDLNAFTHTQFMKNLYGADGWNLERFVDLVSSESYINPFLKRPTNLLHLRDCIAKGASEISDLFVFDVHQYIAKQFDLLAAPGICPLEHLFEHGLHENRLRAMGLLDPNVVYGAEGVSDYTIAQLQAEPFAHTGFGSLLCPDPPQVPLDHVRLGIGVVLYNNSRAEVERLIRSIEHNARSFDGVVYVTLWDNSPTSLDLDWLPALLARFPFTIHRCPENNGFSGGHNALMSDCFGHACTHYIGLNPDGWLLENAFSEALWFSASLSDRALIELKTEPLCHPKWYHPETGQTDWVSGAAFVLPRAIFDSVGGFDPDFPLYCEDVDLSFRVRMAGFGLHVAPSALFYHDITDRFAEDAPQRKQLMLIGTWYLCAKWGHDARAQNILRELARIGVRPDTLPRIRSRPAPDNDISRLLQQERFSRSRYWN